MKRLEKLLIIGARKRTIGKSKENLKAGIVEHWSRYIIIKIICKEDKARGKHIITQRKSFKEDY